MSLTSITIATGLSAIKDDGCLVSAYNPLPLIVNIDTTEDSHVYCSIGTDIQNLEMMQIGKDANSTKFCIDLSPFFQSLIETFDDEYIGANTWIYSRGVRSYSSKIITIKAVSGETTVNKTINISFYGGASQFGEEAQKTTGTQGTTHTNSEAATSAEKILNTDEVIYCNYGGEAYIYGWTTDGGTLKLQ